MRTIHGDEDYSTGSPFAAAHREETVRQPPTAVVEPTVVSGPGAAAAQPGTAAGRSPAAAAATTAGGEGARLAAVEQRTETIRPGGGHAATAGRSMAKPAEKGRSSSPSGFGHRSGGGGEEGKFDTSCCCFGFSCSFSSINRMMRS